MKTLLILLLISLISCQEKEINSPVKIANIVITSPDTLNGKVIIDHTIDMYDAEADVTGYWNGYYEFALKVSPNQGFTIKLNSVSDQKITVLYNHQTIKVNNRSVSISYDDLD